MLKIAFFFVHFLGVSLDFWVIVRNLHLHANIKTIPSLFVKIQIQKSKCSFRKNFPIVSVPRTHTLRILPDMASFAFVSIAVQRVISADAIVLTSVY